jgi:hypothetical protein
VKTRTERCPALLAALTSGLILLSITGCGSTTARSAVSRSSATTGGHAHSSDSVSWLDQCLSQGSLLVSAVANGGAPTRTAPEVISGLRLGGALTGASATAHYVTIRFGPNLTYLAGLQSGEPMWVVAAPVPGLNRISSLDQGRTPGTSPLDGLPVYSYQVVSDATGQSIVSSECAMRTPNN